MYIWIIFFILGLFTTVLGFALLFYKCRVNGFHQKYFLLAAIVEFLACYLYLYPVVVFENISNYIDMNFSLMVYSFFTSIVQTISIVSGNGYETANIDNDIFRYIYGICRSISALSLMGFISGFVLKVFEGPFKRLIFSVKRNSNIFIFSDCNDKTISIAKSLGDDAMLVFACDVNEVDDRLRDLVNSINGMFLDEDLVTVINKSISKKAASIEVFLFGEEEYNLSHFHDIAEGLVISCKDTVIKVFAEISKTPWTLYDDYTEKIGGASSGNLKFNFVRTEENFAYNLLIDHSIFTYAVSKKETKYINVLIVGFNERNIEILKTVLWLSQMPGYYLNLLFIDKEDHSGVLRNLFPEIIFNEPYDKYGDAIYNFIYRPNTDIDTDALEETLEKELPDVNFAFINDSDDISNLNYSMRINALLNRMGRKDDYYILANMNKNICSNCNEKAIKGITVVGEYDRVYDHNCITNFKLEKASKEIHKLRYPDAEKNDPKHAWDNYYNNEYNRHSVYARTLSFSYKILLIDKYYDGDYSLSSSREWKIYEHMRWDVYSRTCGLRLCPKSLLTDGELDKNVRNLARVHNDLIPFDELPASEQEKDSLLLDDRTVKIIKDIVGIRLER